MFAEREMVKALRWLISLYIPEDYDSGYDEEEYGEDGGLCLSEVCMGIRDKAEMIYQYEVRGNHELCFDYRGKELFEMRGCNLYCKNDSAVADGILSAYNTELWLLEDMTFAIVRCVHMTIEVGEVAYETEYRAIVKRVSDRDDLCFTPEELLSELEEMCVPQWECTATIYEI